MKNRVLLAGILMISAITFGQKKEIKKAEKAIKAGEAQEALEYLASAEALVPNADNELKAQFYAAKGEALFLDAGNDLAKLKMSSKAFKMANEAGPSQKTKESMNVAIQNLKILLEKGAVSDFNAKKFKSSAEKYMAIYDVSQTDTLFLFNSALAAKNGKEYDDALAKYKNLIDMGYTGITKSFVATNKESGKEEASQTMNERDLVVKFGTHDKPGLKVSESKKDDILRNITAIYIEQGENQKALDLMKELRANNPNDATLLRAEADMVYRMGDVAKYNELMAEVIKADPTNPELYFNLGVGSAQNGDEAKAKEYYAKAIELKPDYAAAQINMAALILAGEGAVVDEMNNLGTSRADNERYDVLKAKRNGIYNSAIPYLEAAIKSKNDNPEIVRTLMNIYSQTGNDAKFKELKAKLQAMEGGR